MEMRGYSTFPKVFGLKPHHQMVLCHKQDSHLVGSYCSAEMQSAYFTAPAAWDIEPYMSISASYLSSLLLWHVNSFKTTFFFKSFFTESFLLAITLGQNIGGRSFVYFLHRYVYVMLQVCDFFLTHYSPQTNISNSLANPINSSPGKLIAW